MWSVVLNFVNVRMGNYVRRCSVCVRCVDGNENVGGRPDAEETMGERKEGR